MRVDADGFSIDFTDALQAFVFDEKDKNNPMFHGVPMKAVDIVAEFANMYLYVEIKEFHDPIMYHEELPPDDEREGRSHFSFLITYLKYKYRDSYLFRCAEQKADKPVRYICLLNFDNAMNTRVQKELQRNLPVGLASTRWKLAIAESCHAVNLERWNKNFPDWPARRILIT